MVRNAQLVGGVAVNMLAAFLCCSALDAGPGGLPWLLCACCAPVNALVAVLLVDGAARRVWGGL